MSFQQTIAQKNLDISIVELKNLWDGFRFDSEYYLKEYVQLDDLLQKNGGNVFENYTTFIKKWIFDISPDHYVEQDWVPFIRSWDLKDIFISSNNEIIQIDKESHQKEIKTELLKDDILLSKVGTIWDFGLNLRFEKLNLSQNVVGIKIKKEYKKISWFLVAFLNSKYWRLQINRKISWQVQQKLTLDDVKFLYVPKFSGNIIEKTDHIIRESFDIQEQSKSLYKQAEKILLSEFGLEKYRSTENTISIKNSGEVRIFSRMDAEFFQPKYDEIVEKISKTKTDTLEHITDYKKWVEPWSEAYTDDKNWVPFVRVSDISINGIDRIEKKISPELAESYKWAYSPKKGEVLITKDGTIGISCTITEDVDSILSWAFLRLQPKIKIEQEYLALVLNSIVCKLQIERFSGWAIIEHLKPSDLMQIKIPIVAEPIQQKIAELVTQSHKARNRSKKLLEVAKRAVEIFIEEDEKKAMEFINKNI